ncbi:MAG TPA: glycosyl hydrolase [Sphingomonas sp.]
MEKDERARGWQRREVMGAGTALLAAQALPVRAAARETAGAGHPHAAELARLFADPPLRARPGCYWYWMGGAVTDAGITRDLEEMRKAGIGTAMLFSIGKSGEHPLVTPAADALTETWWARVAHAAREAERIGVELAFNACDGWATASGPWITPELSMQHVVWTERFVDGGAVDVTAARPEATLDYYRDIALLALPVGAGWEETSASRHATVTSNLPVSDLAKLADPANFDQVIDTDHGGWFQFAFDAPFTLRSVTVRTPHASNGYAAGVYRAANSLWVEASDDGVHFRPVGRLDYPEHGWQTDMTALTHALPPMTARMFRLVHKPEGPFGYEEERDFGQDTALRLASLTLSAMPAIQSLPVKSGEQWGRARRMRAADVPDADCIPLSAAIDCSSDMAPDGRLRRTLPAGRWRILRVGYTTTGKGNSAAGAGQGLECSRFEREAIDSQYDGWFAKVRDRLGSIGKALGTIHVDSWEAGTQNWSPRFAEEFRARRGYDLKPWLPVMAGVPMASADATERVLFDVRRTIADLVRDVFYTRFSERAKADGVRFTGEPANPTFPVDGLDYARFLDMPMGEYWYRSPRNDKPNDIKDAVSGGRIYGRSVIGAESFTEVLIDWTEQPAKWKALGDHNWCEGVNRFMLHVWAGQPWPDRAPGMTLNGIGTQMNYLQSWWKPGKSWFDYLGRSQALLQQGRAVADIAYFIGEDIPTRALLPRQLRPALPAGHAYDSINRDALLRLATVEGGWLVLPGGARYRLLVLPPADRMTPELAAKLADMAAAGLAISGPRPVASPSLAGGAQADRALDRSADALWGSGRVRDHADLAPLLREAGLVPDLVVEGADRIEWTHRQGPDWDLYFLSNQGADPVSFTAAMRVAGRAPELWDSEHATMTTPGVWREEGGVTTMPLRLDGHGSVFILFAEPSAGLPAARDVLPAASEVVLSREGRALRLSTSEPGRWTVRTDTGTRDVAVSAVRPAQPVEGPWIVRFADRLPAPRMIRLTSLSSWTEQADPAIRFYSGLATYSGVVMLPAVAADERLWLDLGRVESLATVRLNGRELGSLFKPPFLIEIGAAARPGRNLIEIDVANTWRNRLIGDDGKPESERVSFVQPMLRKGTKWLPGGPGVEPDPAGLLGPVRIITRKTVDINRKS